MGNRGSSHPIIPPEDVIHIREWGFTVDQQILGEGFYGKVFRAQLKERNEYFGNQKTFAIKMINLKELNAINNERLIESIEREKAIMNQISHRNVVSIHLCLSLGDSVSSFIGGRNVIVHDRVYMIMDLAQQSLFAFLYKDRPKKSFPEIEAKSLCRQMIEGLQYLHSNQIIHGDIHMENVLIFTDRQTKQNIPKWADYGMSQRNVTDPALFADDVRQFKTYIFQRLVNSTMFTTNQSLSSANDLVNQMLNLSLDQILNHNWLKNG